MHLIAIRSRRSLFLHSFRFQPDGRAIPRFVAAWVGSFVRLFLPFKCMSKNSVAAAMACFKSSPWKPWPAPSIFSSSTSTSADFSRSRIQTAC